MVGCVVVVCLVRFNLSSSLLIAKVKRIYLKTNKKAVFFNKKQENVSLRNFFNTFMGALTRFLLIIYMQVGRPSPAADDRLTFSP